MGFSCSQPDSTGRQISLAKVPITKKSGQVAGCRCFLKPGYEALVTVYLYNDSHKQTQPGASLPFEFFLVTNVDELKKANCLDLQTEETKRRERLLVERDLEYSASNWGMRALVRMGAYTGLIV